MTNACDGRKGLGQDRAQAGGAQKPLWLQQNLGEGSRRVGQSGLQEGLALWGRMGAMESDMQKADPVFTAALWW